MGLVALPGKVANASHNSATCVLDIFKACSNKHILNPHSRTLQHVIALQLEVDERAAQGSEGGRGGHGLRVRGARVRVELAAEWVHWIRVNSKPLLKWCDYSRGCTRRSERECSWLETEFTAWR